MTNIGTEGGKKRESVRLYVRPFHADTWDAAEKAADASGASLSEWVSRAVALRLEADGWAGGKYRGE